MICIDGVSEYGPLRFSDAQPSSIGVQCMALCAICGRGPSCGNPSEWTELDTNVLARNNVAIVRTSTQVGRSKVFQEKHEKYSDSHLYTTPSANPLIQNPLKKKAEML